VITVSRNIASYEKAYHSDYGFESVMVFYRRKFLLERLNILKPKTVLEIGCGSELLYKHYCDQVGLVDKWVIVEPGRQFAETARSSNLPNLIVIESFFEDAVEQVHALMPCAPDFVVCSGLLHEVPDAQQLLTAIVEILRNHSVLHVNVPNASSFHRQLARSMGLIHDLKSLSVRNQKLIQNRVYNRESLDCDLKDAGLSIEQKGGYLVKPFTHKQMEKITSHLGDPVLNGLYQLGKELPELASEIYAEARKLDV